MKKARKSSDKNSDHTERKDSTTLLRDYIDVFARIHEDLHGLGIIVYRVPLKKKRVCVDFRDLNCASPRGNLPPPHTDV